MCEPPGDNAGIAASWMAYAPAAITRCPHMHHAVARASGQPLNVLPDDIAERTARDWESITDFSRMHFDEMVAILDAADPSFRE